MGFIYEFLFLFNEMAVYLLLGFGFAGLLRTFFSDKLIIRYLGGRSFKSTALAAIFGIPLPLCSCGVVPAAMSLHRQGASKGSVISFLTSTPQTGIDSIFVTYGFLGLPLALYKLLAALVTGIMGGMLYNTFEKTSDREDCITSSTSLFRIRSVKAYFQYSFIELVDLLKNWILLGVFVAAAISFFLPDDIFDRAGLSEAGIFTYLLVIVIAPAMYVCATASVPIAATLIMKGFPAGVAIIFLIAGPATSAANVAMLWKTLGRKATLAYLINIIIGSLLFAYFFDVFFPDYRAVHLETVHEHVRFGPLNITGSVVLAGLIIFSYARWCFLNKNKPQINEITCGGCIDKRKNQG